MSHARLVYGHRGAPAEFPENTIPSFQRAIDVGADALETDVRMTADGHVIVAHDESGLRMAGVDRQIRHCDLAEVQGWDVGKFAKAKPDDSTAYQAPTFAELLETFPDMHFNVDLKQEQPSMITRFIDVVRKHAAEERVRAASFSGPNLRELRKAGYRGPISMTSREISWVVLGGPLARWIPIQGTAAQIPTRHKGICLDSAKTIRRIHCVGARVDFWTINDPCAAKRLIDLGADGIITDDPKTIVTALKK